MAATEKTEGFFTELSVIDADWDIGETTPIHSIKFYPGAADDEVQIFAGAATGAGVPEICRLTSGNGEPRVEYFGGNLFRPYIDFSECTLSAGHKVIIVRDRLRK